MTRQIVFWMLACLIGLAGPAAAEKKVALVIGNSQYQHATPLPNPTRDAEDMASMLTRIGFDVVAGTDLDREAMGNKIREFAAKAEGADTVLYFYAGHGIQLSGQNYLIPIDADLNTEMDVKLSALDIDLMLQQTPASAQLKLVLLDACRNNPFKEQIARSMGKTRSATLQNGLAEMKPTYGTLIAYATGPGEVALDGKGQNSPFTKALIRYLPEQGLEIGQAMTRIRAAVYEDTGNQQLPWENKNLVSDYYLQPAPAKKPVEVAALEAEPQAAEPEASKKSWTEDNGEIVLWQAVKDSTDPTELQAYLDKYGEQGMFAGSAKKRMAALEAKAALPEVEDTAATEKSDKFAPNPAIATAEASLATEAKLTLGKTDKKILHIKLSALGFGSRSLGNDFNEQSRMAIAKWQSARGYPVTGYLNKFMYEALLNDDAEDEEEAVAETDPQQQTDPEPAYKKPVYKADPKPVYKKPAYKAEPKPVYKPVYKKPVYKAEPKPVYKKPVRKAVEKPPAKKVKRVVVADPVVKKRKPVKQAGKRPRINIHINSGGGFGIGFGF